MVIDQVKQFVNSIGEKIRFPKSKWFEDNQMKAYVRYNQFMPFKLNNGQIEYKTVLTVANVTVFEEHRGKGIYGRFLQQLETISDNIDAIIIENVSDYENHEQIYTSRGYKMADFNEGSPWYIKKLNP